MSDLNGFLRLIREFANVSDPVVPDMREFGFPAEFREYARIIELMDPDERASPQLFDMAPARVERVAERAGASTNTVLQLLLTFSLLNRSTGSLPLQSRPAPGLCDAYHGKMAAGKCPWCGSEIF
ncbi:MAG: hypothetical protein CMJ58_14280 [Planctomycetaceae bacterium]|nr:hypothetical protein [Planctomycetaceae bacterium]